MAKRRLSEQQRTRIARKQQKLIDGADSGDGNELKGRVYARYSRHVSVKPIGDDSKEAEASMVKCHVRANVDSITVGDYVAYSVTENGKGIILAVDERQSEILRPDGLGKLKPVAANIDQVFIMLAAEPEAHPNLIDRYLIAAENANIEAKLIFNKAELGISDNIEALLATYHSLGYEVFLASAHKQQGLEDITAALSNKTSIFVGQSGVGKSSLINVILPEVNARVGSLSEHVVKGRHTTTSAELFALEQGGFLIDSPGIREFHLNHLSREEVFKGYREFNDIEGHCQFRNCQHDQEPNCVYTTLIDDDNAMADSRVQSLRYILSSLGEE